MSTSATPTPRPASGDHVAPGLIAATCVSSAEASNESLVGRIAASAVTCSDGFAPRIAIPPAVTRAATPAMIGSDTSTMPPTASTERAAASVVAA